MVKRVGGTGRFDAGLRRTGKVKYGSASLRGTASVALKSEVIRADRAFKTANDRTGAFKVKIHRDIETKK